jgi:RimJ/RimL family protein N-acetyltransferase
VDNTPTVPVVRGEKVYLRAPERDDIETFVRWFNDARVIRFLSMDSPMSRAAEDQWFERALASQGKDAYHFVMCRREDDERLGTIGLFGIDLKHGTAVMGIAIGEPAYWGQGLGTDALRALLDFGFGILRLDRIGLDVYAFNERARRSYEKCGFVLEGTMRQGLYRDGKRHDVHLMGILREEWVAQKRPRSWELP